MVFKKRKKETAKPGIPWTPPEILPAGDPAYWKETKPGGKGTARIKRDQLFFRDLDPRTETGPPDVRIASQREGVVRRKK